MAWWWLLVELWTDRSSASSAAAQGAQEGTAGAAEKGAGRDALGGTKLSGAPRNVAPYASTRPKYLGRYVLSLPGSKGTHDVIPKASNPLMTNGGMSAKRRALGILPYAQRGLRWNTQRRTRMRRLCWVTECAHHTIYGTHSGAVLPQPTGQHFGAHASGAMRCVPG